MTTRDRCWISDFRGKHRFLSNFYPSRVELDREAYPTVEHAYQAAKTLDTTYRRLIRGAATPGEAKKLGRYALLRPGWNQIRILVMRTLLQQKFAIPELRDALLFTLPWDLEESNSWGDQFWGTVNGVGHNHLGKLLMEIRDEIAHGDQDFAR